MSTEPENPVAFPNPGMYFVRDNESVEINPTTYGMSLRDYFAAKALQGFLANSGGPIQPNGMTGWGLTNCDVKYVAEYSYDFADAMLLARARPQPKQAELVADKAEAESKH
jgi:hypothetical protein